MTIDIASGETNSIRLKEQVSAPATPASGYGQLYAKADGLYFKDDAGVEVGPVSIPTSSTQASRPAAGKTGNTFYPTDGFYIQRDNGSAWETWGPVRKLTPPVLSDFAWIDQGTATAVQTYGPITMTAQAAAGVNWKFMKKAAPATPYNVELCFLHNMLPVNNMRFGFVWRNSSSGNLVVASYCYSNGFYAFVESYSTPTSAIVSQYLSSGLVYQNPIWMRCGDNGSSRYVDWSGDGLTWLNLYSGSRTTYITPDEIGFTVNAQNATYAMTANLLHWKVG